MAFSRAHASAKAADLKKMLNKQMLNKRNVKQTPVSLTVTIILPHS